MAVKRSADDASLNEEEHQEPPKSRPRRGISPALVVEDASAVMASFCKATGATSFFEMYEEETKRLVHGAVVTPMSGYCFFEDIDTNTFASSLAVPFAEYRYDKQSHVGLHVNVVSAPEVVSRMKACTHLGRASTTVVPVQKQFWGAELGIERDGCGILWTLSSKAESDMDPCPKHVESRAGVCVPDPAAYLAFLKEAFGAGYEEKDVMRDSSGILHAELLIHGSGLAVDRHSEGDCMRERAASLKQDGYASFYLSVPRGQAKSVAKALAESGGAIVKEPQLRFYGQVTGNVQLPGGVMVPIMEPQIESGRPSKEDMDAYAQIGEKHGWDMVCTIKTLPFRRIAGIRTADKVAMAELQAKHFFHQTFEKVCKVVGSSIRGPACAIYHFADPVNGVFTVTAGFPVSDDFALPSGESQVEIATMPEQISRCAHTTFVGDYEGLPKAWGTLMAWYKARGCEMEADLGIVGVEVHTSMGCAETGETPVTEMFCPVASIREKDTDANAQIGQKNGLDMVCTLKMLPFRRVAGIRTADKVAMAELQAKDFFRQTFKKVCEVAGSSVCGPPCAVYHFADPANGLFTVTAGFPVSDDFALPPGESQVDIATVPEQISRCAHTTFVGEHEGLPEAWGTLMAWYKVQGCEMEADLGIVGVEVHTSMGCAKTGEAPVTEIFCPVTSIREKKQASDVPQ